MSTARSVLPFARLPVSFWLYAEKCIGSSHLEDCGGEL
jgi:hypothetical protein